jgi:hypothetical protein
MKVLKNLKMVHKFFKKGQKDDFDRDWMSYNGKVNFIENHRKLLGHHGNDQYRLPQRERENEEPQIYQRNFQDEQKRGEFIPNYKKLPSMPVRVNNNPYNQYGEYISNF